MKTTLLLASLLCCISSGALAAPSIVCAGTVQSHDDPEDTGRPFVTEVALHSPYSGVLYDGHKSSVKLDVMVQQICAVDSYAPCLDKYTLTTSFTSNGYSARSEADVTEDEPFRHHLSFATDHLKAFVNCFIADTVPPQTR